MDCVATNRIASDRRNRCELYSSVDCDAIHTLWWAFICAGVLELYMSMVEEKLENVRNLSCNNSKPVQDRSPPLATAI